MKSLKTTSQVVKINMVALALALLIASLVGGCGPKPDTPVLTGDMFMNQYGDTIFVFRKHCYFGVYVEAGSRATTEPFWDPEMD